jgi:ABC-2 type transport system ATP-binding protein
LDEVQNVLTDLVFLNRGRVVLETTMEDFERRYCELRVNADQLSAARALGPINERLIMGRTVLLFEGVDRAQLAGLGEVRTPSVADLFVALMGPQGQAQGAAQ